MKKLMVILVLFTSLSVLYSYDKSSFDRVVDFSADLKQISGTVKGDSPKTNKVLILDGSVSSINIINKKEDSFEAVLELVAGEWQGLEDVTMYSTYIRFKGKEFYKRFPTRKVKKNLQSIQSNKRIIVVGSLSKNCENIPEAEKLCLEAFYVRVIK